jgi:IclR family transcriptional regulator, acetate operon repressor
MKAGRSGEKGQRKDLIDTQRDINLSDILLETDKKSATVQSVFRAANILSCMSHGIYSITDIASICKLNKATVHRLLKALVESRLAIQDPVNHRYYLGQSIAKMVARPDTTHEYLITCAVRPMLQLSDLTEETVFLSILLGVQYINLFEVPSKHDLRVVQVDKKSGYVPAGASSRVLLSQLNGKDLKIALLNIDFNTPTGNGVLNEGELKAELKEVKRKGYSVSYGERIRGCICVSSPVPGYVLPVALSIIGPESRIEPRLNEAIKVVKTAAAGLSAGIALSFNNK